MSRPPIPPHGQPSRRSGLRRERATDTRDASYRRYQAKSPKFFGITPDAANVLFVTAKYGPITDREVSRRLTAAKGVDFPPGRVSARRAELVQHADGALVEKAERKRDEDTKATAWAWRVTVAGLNVLAGLGVLR